MPRPYNKPGHVLNWETGFCYSTGLGSGGTAGGGSAKAVISQCHPFVLCELSQNGFFWLWPHLQSEIEVRPARSNLLPLWSTISNSPSTRRLPLFLTMILAGMRVSLLSLIMDQVPAHR